MGHMGHTRDQSRARDGSIPRPRSADIGWIPRAGADIGSITATAYSGQGGEGL